MPKPNTAPRLHRGVFIYRSENPAALPWYTIAPNLRADTLAGLKELICEYQE